MKKTKLRNTNFEINEREKLGNTWCYLIENII